MNIAAENEKNDTGIKCEIQFHPYESQQKSIDGMGNSLE